MKLVIDTTRATFTRVDGETEATLPLYSKEAFEALSLQWLRVGWSLKYYHNFAWFGLPILQLPEDVMRLQEVIYQVRPQVIVETGVFRGGSLLFHATLLQALGGGHVIGGQVIGVDREILPDVRDALASHALAPGITLIEGDSTDPSVVRKVTEKVKQISGAGAAVLVILDSDHARAHVARELECYAPLVTPGSYIVATDGITRDLSDVPRGNAGWKTDNPFSAACAFAAAHPEFRQEQPRWPARDSDLTENITYWPGAWFRRTS
ncbi:MAG TPA: CmcI family methyltransferase [Bryobacteraceae bacterium]|nr:CmcI family methyltransferase [Bryobacteraceae bacterium]